MSNFEETKVNINNRIVELINKVRETFESDCTNIVGKASEGTKSKDKIKILRIGLKNEVRNNPSLKGMFLNEIAEIEKIIVNRDSYISKLNKVKNNSELKGKYENNKTNYTDGRCKIRTWVWKAIESISEGSVAGQYNQEEMGYINEQLDIINDLLDVYDSLLNDKELPAAPASFEQLIDDEVILYLTDTQRQNLINQVKDTIDIILEDYYQCNTNQNVRSV